MKNTSCCWSRWELKEVIPSTPTLLPSSHPPVHPTFRSIWRPITCMPLVHLCLPPRIELSIAQTCDRVREHSHTHRAYTLRRTVVYTFWSVDIDFLKARLEAVSWSTLSTYQSLHFFSAWQSKVCRWESFYQTLLCSCGQTTWAQRCCQRP